MRDLKPKEKAILMYLKYLDTSQDKKQITLTKISSGLEISKYNLSKDIKSLEKKGYINTIILDREKTILLDSNEKWLKKE
ncbi:MAG: MarR family transcriptional regulator [Candidatus Woesearchaeota archaeon]